MKSIVLLKDKEHTVCIQPLDVFHGNVTLSKRLRTRFYFPEKCINTGLIYFQCCFQTFINMNGCTTKYFLVLFDLFFTVFQNFFQRNLSRKAWPVCPSNEYCSNCTVIRKLCPTCRYEKCVSVGMSRKGNRLVIYCSKDDIVQQYFFTLIFIFGILIIYLLFHQTNVYDIFSSSLDIYFSEEPISFT